MTVVVATRSTHKLGEIRSLLQELPGFDLIDLEGAGIPLSAEEDLLEVYSSFEENALAKARYFAARSAGRPVLADDSGLCVDALGGAPGVLSKRFAGRQDLSGLPLDQANNARLLRELGDTPGERRTARYVCALALVTPDGVESVAVGTVEGRILDAPRGTGGFGYDPLFESIELGVTFAEVPAAEKNRVSHRARAAFAALPSLRDLDRS